MRIKIALMAAFAGLLAAAALGAAIAGAAGLGEGSNLTPQPPATAVPSLGAPACANGTDDDADGLVDLLDPDCKSAEGTSAAPTATTTSASPAAATATAAASAPPAPPAAATSRWPKVPTAAPPTRPAARRPVPTRR